MILMWWDDGPMGWTVAKPSDNMKKFCKYKEYSGLLLLQQGFYINVVNNMIESDV